MTGRIGVAALSVALAGVLSACSGWQGLNSLPLPGTAGGGPDSFEIKAEFDDVTTIEENSRVRVGDVTVGNVTKIELQDWHAVVTMTLQGDVDLPANATATVGQTSLLGSEHVELAPPVGEPPVGRLTDGSVIPLPSGTAYPTTEKTLATISVLLNGGGLGQVQDITQAFATAFAGREGDLRSLITQLDVFITKLDEQTSDIIAANESLNGLVGQLAESKPVVDRALTTIPEALAVLDEQRTNLVDALDAIGRFGALANSTITRSREDFVKELRDLWPVLEQAANAGPSLTRSLSFLLTFPWPKESLGNWIRGDYANLSVILDLTYSRLDSSLLVGTRFDGDLTRLDMRLGRTVGIMPSPATAGNPITYPYQFNQGP